MILLLGLARIYHNTVPYLVIIIVCFNRLCNVEFVYF